MGWYRDLKTGERRTLWACFSGWALDGMDVQIYTFLIPALTAAWGLTKGDAGLLQTVALLTSAFGGWITGMLADRVGRVTMLQITILWFAFFTALSGFTQSFDQLLIMRGLQGLGFGGEWAAGSVLIAEVIKAKHRGKAVGLVQSGWAPGWALAAVASSLALAYLPAEWGWRMVFFIGIAPAILVFFLRRLVREPEVYEIARDRARAGVDRRRVTDIFSPALIRTTILGALLSAGANGGYYAITTWLPTFLREVRGLTIFGTGGYIAVIIAGSFAGYLTSAYLTDAIGRRWNFLFFAVCSFVTVLVYTRAAVDDSVMLVLGFPLGFFSSGIFSGMGAFFTELFPTRVRASGQGFCYNFGRGLGALNPWLVGLLGAAMPLGSAIGWFAGAAYGLVIVAALLLPETRGKTLE
jgi:MFS family permease